MSEIIIVCEFDGRKVAIKGGRLDSGSRGIRIAGVDFKTSRMTPDGRILGVLKSVGRTVTFNFQNNTFRLNNDAERRIKYKLQKKGFTSNQALQAITYAERIISDTFREAALKILNSDSLNVIK